MENGSDSEILAIRPHRLSSPADYLVAEVRALSGQESWSSLKEPQRVLASCESHSPKTTTMVLNVKWKPLCYSSITENESDCTWSWMIVWTLIEEFKTRGFQFSSTIFDTIYNPRRVAVNMTGAPRKDIAYFTFLDLFKKIENALKSISTSLSCRYARDLTSTLTRVILRSWTSGDLLKECQQLQIIQIKTNNRLILIGLFKRSPFALGFKSNSLINPQLISRTRADKGSLCLPFTSRWFMCFC